MHLGKIALSLALLAGAAQLAAAQPRGVIIQRQAIPLPGKAVSRVATPSETDTPDAPTIVPGKWDIKYHWKGVLTSVWGFDDGTQGQRSVAWADDGSNVAEAGGRVLPEDYPGAGILEINAASYITTGTVTVVCAWVPNLDGYDPPPLNPQAGPAPKTLTLREIPYALAHQETNTTSSADDGMGDAAALGNNVLTSQSAGHLTTHAVTNNKVTITHAMSAQTNLNYDWDWQDVQLSYKVVEDTRTLSLKRSEAWGETFDADGTGHGDTIYSSRGPSILYAGDNDTWNWQLFESFFGGGWHTRSGSWLGLGQEPDVTWTWTPSEKDNDIYNGHDSMPFGMMQRVSDTWGNVHWTVKGSPALPLTISYSATDNQDGVSATANYMLTVHEHAEWEDEVITPVNKNRVATDTPPNWVYAQYDNEPLALYCEHSSSYQTTGSVNLDLPLASERILGLGLQFSYTNTINSGVQLTVSTLKAGWGTYLQVVDTYDDYSGHATQWATGGLIARHVPYAFEVPRGRLYVYADPEQRGSLPPSH